MKRICYIFLYLNIYTGFFLLANSQEINLYVSFQTSIPKPIEDDLVIIQKHDDFKSIEKEVERLSEKLEIFGYLENSLNSLERISDSTVTASFYVGKRYTQLKIDYSNTKFTKNEIGLISKNTKKNYFTIPIQQSIATLEKLNQLQTKNGNTFGKLKLTNLTTQDTIILATLETSAPSKRTIDSIAVNGYQKFPASFIKY